VLLLVTNLSTFLPELDVEMMLSIAAWESVNISIEVFKGAASKAVQIAVSSARVDDGQLANWQWKR
jgi:hypothetical protein